MDHHLLGADWACVLVRVSLELAVGRGGRVVGGLFDGWTVFWVLAAVAKGDEAAVLFAANLRFLLTPRRTEDNEEGLVTMPADGDDAGLLLWSAMFSFSLKGTREPNALRTGVGLLGRARDLDAQKRRVLAMGIHWEEAAWGHRAWPTSSAAHPHRPPAPVRAFAFQIWYGRT